MDTLVNLETGEIDWEGIKKLSKQAHLDKNSKKFYCKNVIRVSTVKIMKGNFLFV